MNQRRLITSEGELREQYDEFCRDPDIMSWLEDAAYFAAVDDTIDSFSWYQWPSPLKDRHLVALVQIYESRRVYINTFIAQQFLFQRQWKRVRDYARKKGVKIMGDMPIYVGYHSADNRKGYPFLVSGVPPDAFSETRQLWGSPLYDWKAMKQDGFSWWVRRMRRAKDLYDEFRIDHFRGFAGFWAISSGESIALNGKSLFDAILREVGQLDIIAEDLGVITEDVVELRKSIGAPGMSVLQFGFGGDADNPHLLHNHESNQVAYSGFKIHGSSPFELSLARCFESLKGGDGGFYDELFFMPTIQPWQPSTYMCSRLAKREEEVVWLLDKTTMVTMTGPLGGGGKAGEVVEDGVVRFCRCWQEESARRKKEKEGSGKMQRMRERKEGEDFI
ncbi:hypothetical protein V2J09_016832 [Rumex salicifolius]